MKLMHRCMNNSTNNDLFANPNGYKLNKLAQLQRQARKSKFGVQSARMVTLPIILFELFPLELCA